ncbi:NAD(P)-dependent oxidoreductase [Kribbella sp. CA-293567]|uniref:NAD(P)-dependent oxidoreductase n=1 Tax=Kribbella sp. CA-293567 TaxID=3002436 RepID=UPI0022DE5395|nr:NAD(P)-binding domain-containing protein [Kribbella sp. CA-293567]WBQ04355.1 NAD(P)-binding domain-containing protein [Kribbella sp. CA-293567]
MRIGSVPIMTTNQDLPTAAVLGLGPMGRALAHALLASGHQVTVWNRSHGKAAELAAAGAKVSDSPADAVADAALVVLCLLDYQVVGDVLLAAGGALDGRTVVNLTSGSPQAARSTAEQVTSKGARYLDGTILSPAATIGTSDAVLLYSGSSAVYEANKVSFAAFSGSQRYLGEDAGRAAGYDVALVGMYWTAVVGVIHGLTLGKSEGIEAAELVAFSQGIIGLLPGYIPVLAESIDSGIHPGDASTLRSTAAGIEHALHSAEQRGIDPGLLRAAAALTRQAIRDGYGDEAVSRLSDTIRAGLPRS